MSEDLQRQLTGVQEMLGQVLYEVGKPVVISKDRLRTKLPEGSYVDITDTGDAFVFSIKVSE